MDSMRMNVSPTLCFENVVVKTQLPDLDAAGNQKWSVVAVVPLQHTSKESTVAAVQKVEKEDTECMAESISATVGQESSSVRFSKYGQHPLEGQSAISEDDYIITFNNSNEESNAKNRTNTGQKGESSKFGSHVCSPAKYARSKESDFAGRNTHYIDNSYKPLVAVVDDIKLETNGNEKAKRRDLGIPELSPIVQNESELTDKRDLPELSPILQNESELAVRRDLPELSPVVQDQSEFISEEIDLVPSIHMSLCDIEVVEKDVSESEDGEIIQELSQSRHGSNSETFLSQMRFFGGRTWARGRGRGRSKGCAREKDVTNIALKLIETDQLEDADHDQYTSVEEDDIDGDKFTAGTESSSSTQEINEEKPLLCGKDSESLGAAILAQHRRSQRSGKEDLKKIDSSASVRRRGRGDLKKETVRGRGRSKETRRGRGRPRKTTASSATDCAEENVNDDDNESSDEQTLAAMRSSLQEIRKDNKVATNSDESKVDEGMDRADSSKNSFAKVKSSKCPNKGKKGRGKRSSSNVQETAHASASLIDEDKGQVDSMKNSVDKMKRTKSPNKDKGQVDSMKNSVDKMKRTKGPNKGKKGRGKVSSSVQETAHAPASPTEEVVYESDDEDTQAAIRASLEELKKEQLKRALASNAKVTNEEQTRKEKSSLPSATVELVKIDPFINFQPDGTAENASRAVGFQSKTNSSLVKDKLRDKLSRRMSADDMFSSTPTEKRLSLKRHMIGCQADEELLSAIPQQVQSSPALKRPTPSTEKCKIKTKVNSLKSACSNQHDIVTPGTSRVSSSPVPDICAFDNIIKEPLHRNPELDKSSVNNLSRVQCKTHSSRELNVLDIESEDDKSYQNTPVSLNVSATDSSQLDTNTSSVKQGKSSPRIENSPCDSSSHSPSATSGCKRQHSFSDDELSVRSTKVLKRSQPEESISSSPHSSLQHHDRISVPDVTPVLGAAKSPDSNQQESLMKSVGGMMSHLFGDNMLEECPNGFTIRVRLDVEKKKDGDSKTDSSQICYKASKPEMCSCIKDLSDVKLASVLKERVENRRDLTVTSKGSLLAMVLQLMQELGTGSSKS